MCKILEGLDDYNSVKCGQDTLKLLRLIMSINFNFEDQKYLYGTVMYTERQWHNFMQSKEESNNDYRDKFWNVVESVEKICGPLGYNEILLEQDQDFTKLTSTEKKENKNI